jgi:hypothetical protein
MGDFEDTIRKLSDLTNKEINSIALKQKASGEYYIEKVKICFKANDETAEDNAINQIVRIVDKLSKFGIQPLQRTA